MRSGGRRVLRGRLPVAGLPGQKGEGRAAGRGGQDAEADRGGAGLGREDGEGVAQTERGVTMARKRRGRDEGSVFQRADGLWVSSISLGYTESGKRKRKTVYGATKQEVLDK